MIKYHLSRFNWEYLNSNDYNIDQKVEYFNKFLNKLFISHIPNINNTIKQVLPKNILKLKKQVKKLFRKSKTNLQYKYNWIEAKKKLSKELESLNFKREINAINSKNKLKFYKFIKKRQHLKSGVSPLIDISNNNILFSDLDKANTLNSYFSSIQQNDNGNLPEFYNLTKQKFDNIDLNLEIIKIFLNRLKITHTFGTDGIPSSMLKLLSNELCRPLYIIFNSSLLSGNIHNIQLENVTFYKDLGIIFENNLLFNKHIDYIFKKAYFSLNSIFRCITTKSPRALLNAYKIYCRPILEYASIIWSPFSKVSKFRSLIDQIERVQRLFTRRLITRCVGYTNSSNINYKTYIERLVYFKLESLELRRLKIDLTTIFKISNNYTDINISDILNISNNCRTRGNCKKLNVIHNYDNTIKNIINIRSVNIWNSLNNDIIKSVSVSSFKNKINKICFDKLLFFNRNL